MYKRILIREKIIFVIDKYVGIPMAIYIFSGIYGYQHCLLSYFSLINNLT